MGGQSFSIPLAAGSDQKGSDIPDILFILKVIDRRTENRGPNTGHLTSDTLMKDWKYNYLKKLK
jgi:hypothetical protein